MKAPYNFVPVNHQVVIPHWGEHISHDIPFADGQSGKLELTITAHTPIFVRDGFKEQDADPKKAHRFSQYNGDYFIPATSLKGMLRNVLEIMTFSKLSQVNDHRYAIRDLTRAANEIYLDRFKAKDIYCGWLVKGEKETFRIVDCGNPGRISHRELDSVFSTDLSTYFLKNGRFNAKKDSEKSAQFKYKRFGKNQRTQYFDFDHRDRGERQIYKITALPSNQSEKGQLVFTGQPGPRMQDKNGRWSGHHLEFIFFERPALPDLEVADKVMQNFFFAYHDQDMNRWTEDWMHWRNELLQGHAIPVFFRKDASGKVQDLGISFLYKLPYNNSVKEAIPQYVKEQAIDLAEAIFGFVGNEQDEDSVGLKGRVHIGHAFAGQAEVDEEVAAVLSGPKASYYPTYIRQQVKNGKVGRYQTFMDKQAEIAGWKRYPVRGKTSANPAHPNSTENVVSKFVPLKAGATFTCTIHYHNLKSIELGALLSALTFHNTDITFHSIGMAKPLGYGKIKVVVKNLAEHTRSLKTFEAYMCAELSTRWHQSTQIQDLVAMAVDQDNRGNSELTYMKLDMTGRNNEFKTAKGSQTEPKEALDRYTRLDGIKITEIISLVSKEDITAAYTMIERESSLYRKKQAWKDRLTELKVQQKRQLETALEDWKNKMLQELAEQRKQVGQKHRDARIAQKQAAARDRKPDWGEIDLKHRNAFEDLKKVIMLYVQHYHGDKYPKLVGAMPQGVLPMEYRPELKTMLETIVQHVSNNELKRWQKPYPSNAYLKKIAEWVGRDDAEGLSKKWS